MAQVTTVRLVDDLDGGDAHESLLFALDNRQYELDLSENHAARLRNALAPFIAAARRAGSSTTTRTRRAPTAESSPTRKDPATIREWAAANGIEVSARGRIASSVREAYDTRTPAATVEPAPATPAPQAPAAETVAAETPEAATPAAPTVEAATEMKPKRRSRKKTPDSPSAS